MGAGAAAGSVPSGGRAATAAAPEPSDVVLPGTKYETPVYVLEGERSGPTAVVVGGLHGDERAGYLGAERVTEWRVERGRVVVIPRANRVAIRRDERHGVGGDLNRKFPPGEEPTTRLARALWEAVAERDPDVVVDLHSSTGIYGAHAEFVGQAIFPTDVGDAPAHASAVARHLSRSVVPWYMPLHDYDRGNVMSGTAPLLAHKVGGDLGRPAYIVETTEFLVDPRTGGRWNARGAEALLARHGVERAGERG